MFRFASDFAVSAAVVMGIVLIMPAEIGLSLNEIVSYIALILVSYLLGVLAASIAEAGFGSAVRSTCTPSAIGKIRDSHWGPDPNFQPAIARRV